MLGFSIRDVLVVRRCPDQRRVGCVGAVTGSVQTVYFGGEQG